MMITVSISRLYFENVLFLHNITFELTYVLWKFCHKMIIFKFFVYLVDSFIELLGPLRRSSNWHHVLHFIGKLCVCGHFLWDFYEISRMMLKTHQQTLATHDTQGLFNINFTWKMSFFNIFRFWGTFSLIFVCFQSEFNFNSHFL